MNSLLTLAKDLEQKSKAQQQTTGEMLKAAFSEHEKSVRAELSESEKRISAAILDHDRKLSSAMSQRTKGMLRMVSHTWADHRSGLRAADSVERGHSVVAGAADTRELYDHPGAEEHAGHAVREEQRRTALDLRRAETPLFLSDSMACVLFCSRMVV
ncbi:MbeB family mobilization protein [Klebsiella pneumoniae]|uniref:MbeB family mobilization protein n=1 Tax=Klebsiella pneumoniae TaxID=573 RepID=UPI000A90FEC1|nr:MbeB family mobilization protein [Klebsiella pneumoniae]